MEPKQKGIIILRNISLREISAYINWTYFFSAWKITGNYAGIEEICSCLSCETAFLQKAENREKAAEALQLFKDARELFSEIIENNTLSANATFCIIKAKSENEGIVFYPNDDLNGIYIPMLRQQQANQSAYHLSLADFISPTNDYAGIFAVSIVGADELKNKYESADDTYKSLLVQTVADRLAEAAAEWLHKQIRTTYWSYVPDENLSTKELFKSRYQGIRPAVGYPSLPDQSVIFTLNKILDFSAIGISITENGAMYPTSSICGLLLAHPQSAYFVIGKIGEDQLKDYANRKGVSVEEVKRWLSNF